ncbi:spermatogenesis-associated protein 7 homolog [Rhineura floridana]|uniref:spermatogenesis-associated protein 7 homolog n=1 Tax=Rhineura floridana TaxID=261503 RepID=UPI002AC8748A|nr:spermatogenesis-associated protein 7 homolog [Rhineura floridana]
MISKYSSMGPFTGHMSIKSSPFSPSSSCKLSSQYIIQDHMSTHYRKLLSAKAAVDSSAPKSLNMSTKYQDQQKRQALIKAVEKHKKEMAQIPSAAPPGHSRSISNKCCQNSWNFTSRAWMPSLNKREQYSPQCFKKTHSRIQSPVLSVEEAIKDIVRWSLSQTHKNGRSKAWQCPFPLTKSHLPVLRQTRQKIKIPQKKTFAGDLLDTHAQWFTETKQPFTPKLLKTTSKSFLSKYRYYKASHGKKSLSLDQQSDKRPRTFYRSLEDKCLSSYADYSVWHPVKKNTLSSASLQSLLYAKEEELKYLRFLQELTRDILIRSCYCKEVLGDAFQMYSGKRRRDLDEVKMQRIFEALKDDLNNCTNLSDSSVNYTCWKHRSSHLNAALF